MDITKNSKPLFTTKYFNGETVNYSVCFFTVTFAFLVLKQLLKFAFGLGAGISAGAAAVLAAVVFFILENRFVFNDAKANSLLKKILFYIFCCAIDFGFYCIADFLFTELLNRPKALGGFIAVAAMFFFNYYFARLLVFNTTADASKKKNGRCYRRFFNNRFILFSVLLSALCIGFVFLVFMLFPFGDMTVLRMDLYHQYGPLFMELYERVTHGGSFLYSWTSGGGTSFLGNYFNYLSSPLSFIVLLFDKQDMPYAITALVAVKGMLAAASFTYYLKASQKRHSYASACYGVLYAFCGYFLAYYWNVMWIDGMLLLPLILLGIERIILTRRPLLYIVSLTVMLWSSYYIGYMVCLFSVVYFIAYFFMTSGVTEVFDNTVIYEKRYSLKKVTNNRFFGSALTFAGASLLAGAFCAVSLLPVFMILQSSSATSDNAPTTFQSYFDLLNLVSSHLVGLETTIRSSGDDVLPNIYSGILTALLLPLYFANSKIRLREKAIYLLLVLFFVFGFNNNWANFIWHALHFPNDLPYRFSFIYTFIVLVMAFRCLMHFKGVSYRDVALSGIMWIFVILLLQKFQTNKMDELTVYMSLAFVMVWTGVLLLIHNGKLQKSMLWATLAAIVFCEMIVGGAKSYNFTQNETDYIDNYADYTEAVDYIHENDTDFYREELTYLGTRMDPCIYNYRGISIFSSMAYASYAQNQYSLGMFGNRINSYTYNTQTPLYNMMYGIKYLIKAQESLAPAPPLYSQVYVTKSEKAEVYRNEYSLPIAFEVNADIDGWDNSEGNPLATQQEFFSLACGAGELFTPATYGSTYTDNIDCEDVTQNGTYYFTKSNSDSDAGTVTVNFRPAESGNLYVYIHSPKVETVNFYWNDDEDSVFQKIKEPFIKDLGYREAGEEMSVTLECGAIDADASYFDIYAVTINQSELDAAYELLQLGALKIDGYSDTKITGTLSAGYDGTLYTSIPYDEGWSVYIDGEKAELVKIGNCQLGAVITAGEHTVTLQYTPRGLKAGAAVSAAAYLGAAVFLLLKRKKFKFGKNR